MLNRCAKTLNKTLSRVLAVSPNKKKFLLTTNNEDAQVEMRILDTLHPGRRDLKVMQIVGGGDNIISSLLHERVGSVVGIDLNERQIHLARLKLAVAMSSLTYPEAVHFLGKSSDRASHTSLDPTRLQTLQSAVAPHLPPSSRDFFLHDCADEIAYGILQCGCYESLYANVRRNYLESHGITLGTGGDWSADAAAAARTADLMGSGAVCPAALVCAELGLDTLPPPARDAVLAKLPAHVRRHNAGAARLLRDLAAGALRPSLYTSTLLDGAWTEPSCAPDWLRPRGGGGGGGGGGGREAVRAALAAPGKRLSLWAGNIADYRRGDSDDSDDPDHWRAGAAGQAGSGPARAGQSGPGVQVSGSSESDSDGRCNLKFDLISLSNIFDWAPVDVAAHTVREIASRHLRPGGCVVVRRAAGQCGEILRAAGAAPADLRLACAPGPAGPTAPAGEGDRDSDAAAAPADSEGFSAGLSRLDRNPLFYGGECVVAAGRFW